MTSTNNPQSALITAAADYLRSGGVGEVRAGIILGSGLGGLADHIDLLQAFDYADIPGFPVSTVEFHQGRLIYGRVGGTPVLAMQGRFHHYEGYSLQEVTFPVRVMRMLGADVLLISNACGMLNPGFRKGGLMLLEDHINLIPGSPLTGPNMEELGPRYPDMSRPYSPRLAARIREMARNGGIPLFEGVYVAVPGPQFETRAEYRYLRSLGADVVGMSTVPEVIVGVHMGMEIAAISVITDECDPDKLEPMDIRDILETAARAEQGLTRLFTSLLHDLEA
ncbi:MAG TPA: purine-nucleoside phosphorylase [Bacteroidales bacterium]|nr:purine-nucleoside phosphorylase [Bacteroidales bacterium]